MHIQIKQETDVLNPEFRKLVMEAATSSENKNRKNEMYRRWEILKDRTDIYVRDLLHLQFDPTTVNEMEYALTNYSIGRKIVDKKSKVYANGVKREMPRKTDTIATEDIAVSVKLNTKMKKANTYLKAAKNCLVYVKPVKVVINQDSTKFKYDVVPLFPYNYDTIENPDNREEAMVVILSDFSPSKVAQYSLSPKTEGRTSSTSQRVRGDAHDSVIADTPSDAGADEDLRRYIWWTKNYHFTTDGKGRIVSDTANIENPILNLPFVNMAEAQDGQFWAVGGNDISDMSIKLNALLTHINHVAVTQGYGQLVMSGPNLPKSVKVGPNNAIMIETPEGETVKGDASFISASPPIAELSNLAAMQLGLLLSTNNLSTKGIQTDLSGANVLESGIHMLLDMAELIGEIEEDEELFRDAEPMIYDRIRLWDEYFREKGLLVDDQAKIKMPASFDQLSVNFPPAKVIVSETEELSIIEKRRSLGISTELELLQRDNPSLTEKQAEAKLMKLNDEKIERLQRMTEQMKQQPGAAPPVDDEGDEDADETS